MEGEQKQKTTEDLRQILFATISGVSAGTIAPEKGKSIALLAEKLIKTAELDLAFCELEGRLKGSISDPMVLTGRISNKQIAGRS